jgi:hypothetical protein
MFGEPVEVAPDEVVEEEVVLPLDEVRQSESTPVRREAHAPGVGSRFVEQPPCRTAPVHLDQKPFMIRDPGEVGQGATLREGIVGVPPPANDHVLENLHRRTDVTAGGIEARGHQGATLGEDQMARRDVPAKVGILDQVTAPPGGQIEERDAPCVAAGEEKRLAAGKDLRPEVIPFAEVPMPNSFFDLRASVALSGTLSSVPRSIMSRSSFLPDALKFRALRTLGLFWPGTPLDAITRHCWRDNALFGVVADHRWI